MKKILVSLCLLMTLVSSCLYDGGWQYNPNKSSFKPKETTSDHLIIKEIFYIGHTYENEGYLSSYDEDQYFTIYNPTGMTLYLDSLAIAMSSINPSTVYELNAQENFINTYFGASSILYFPGTGKDYPIEPGQEIVVAKYAIDHAKSFIEEIKRWSEGEEFNPDDYKGYEDFLNLTKANFEWGKTESDPDENKNNPNVPDLKALSESTTFNDISQHVSIALIRLPWTPEYFYAHRTPKKGEKNIVHEINVSNNSFANFYTIEVPYDKVIDCVTLCPKKEYKMRPVLPTIDRGYNGISDSKIRRNADRKDVAGLAITRKYDGKRFVDDNNSTSDFEVKPASLSKKSATSNEE